ncbi:MAG TPA: hypothetical protein VNU68_35795 [Verrucomicrobiae bacterium]|nr:hypothetical protein [Verrucomicrobiae bacterium]
MSLLTRLFERRPDPTRDWGPPSPTLPEFDLNEMRFGALKFGDGFEAAAFLGRPDRIEWPQRDYCTLLYASNGFQIDYEAGQLAYLGFLIGPDDSLPQHPGLRYSQPRVRGAGRFSSIILSPEIERAALEQWLGGADSVDIDAEETILYYTRQGVTLEFELGGEPRRLKRWSLYPASP